MLQVLTAVNSLHKSNIGHFGIRADNILLMAADDDEGYPAVLAGFSNAEFTAYSSEFDKYGVMVDENMPQKTPLEFDELLIGFIFYQFISKQPMH